MAFIADREPETRAQITDQIGDWAKPLIRSDRCIIGPVWDAVLFYLSPLWCVLLFLTLADTNLWYTLEVFNYEHGVLSFVAGALTTSHLLAVVFRSHFNTTVFKRWPLRFTAIPMLLFLALASNLWFLVIMTVIAVVWDVYHAAMQNFGISRIYDMRMGNDAKQGRLLDSMINFVLYASPIAAGVTLAFHAESLLSFDAVGAYALSDVAYEISDRAELIRWIVIPASLAAVAVYIFGYWRLARNGYKVSPQKVALLASTAIASIIAWGFNPFAIAFAAMNLFHAIQYYGILYAREGDNLSSMFGMSKLKGALKALGICAILLVPTLVYGVWDVLAAPDWNAVFALILTVTLMHYWYDGFIWSVRKKEV